MVREREAEDEDEGRGSEGWRCEGFSEVDTCCSLVISVFII